MATLKRITKIIVDILSVLLFIILALVIYAKAQITFNPDIKANYFGYRVFEVASGSMEPTLKVNDVILVSVKDSEYKKDDIIAYASNNAIITHRIVMIDNDKLIVKGDANNTTDAPIQKEQVIGKVVKIFPRLGVWKKVLQEPKILILLCVTLVLFDSALSYKGKNNKDLKVKKIENKKEIKEEPLIDLSKVSELLEEDEVVLPKMKTDEEIESNDYTVRLDLNEIQKNINKTVK